MKKIVTLLSLAGLGGAQGFVFTAGELDFGVVLTGSDFELEAHVVDGVVDGNLTLDVEYEVGEITVTVGADREEVAPGTIPAVGVIGGDPVWRLPNTNEAGVPYVALASEELLDLGNGAADWSTFITFTLGSVTSPSGTGTFSAWSVAGSDPPVFHFSSTNPGATVNNNQFVSEFGHDHFNWAFTEAGLWLVEMTASGTHDTFGAVSATETLRFNVIPEPSTGLMALLSVAGFSLVRRRK